MANPIGPPACPCPNLGHDVVPGRGAAGRHPSDITMEGTALLTPTKAADVTMSLGSSGSSMKFHIIEYNGKTWLDVGTGFVASEDSSQTGMVDSLSPQTLRRLLDVDRPERPGQPEQHGQAAGLIHRPMCQHLTGPVQEAGPVAVFGHCGRTRPGRSGAGPAPAETRAVRPARP